MGVYILKRIARGIVTLIGITVVVFFISHVLGDPAEQLVPIDASNKLLVYTRHSLGLDQPILVQFGHFMSHAVHLDLGPSLFQGTSSRTLVLTALPYTAMLAATAFAIAIVLGISMGIIASRKPNSKLDTVVSAISIACISMPEFWLALLLIVWVAIPTHGALPVSGYGSWKNLILPAIVLATRPTGRIAQVTRSSMIDEARAPYLVTANAKGLARRTILLRHMLKNASIPIVTMSGLEVADLLSGAIVVESIFGWPGVGWLVGNAMLTLDLPLIETVVIFAAVVTVTMNLLVDLSYAWLNPRTRA
jgi:peptide/nickel transport system permease protein